MQDRPQAAVFSAEKVCRRPAYAGAVVRTGPAAPPALDKLRWRGRRFFVAPRPGYALQGSTRISLFLIRPPRGPGIGSDHRGNALVTFFWSWPVGDLRKEFQGDQVLSCRFCCRGLVCSGAISNFRSTASHLLSSHSKDFVRSRPISRCSNPVPRSLYASPSGPMLYLLLSAPGEQHITRRSHSWFRASLGSPAFAAALRALESIESENSLPTILGGGASVRRRGHSEIGCAKDPESATFTASSVAS